MIGIWVRRFYLQDLYFRQLQHIKNVLGSEAMSVCTARESILIVAIPVLMFPNTLSIKLEVTPKLYQNCW